MKKLTAFILIAILVTVAFASPGDVVIIFTIPAAKVAEFRAGFLREHPVPMIGVLDVNDVPIVDANGIPLTETQYTDKQWFKKVIMRYANAEAKHGNDKLAKEAAANDSNIME